MPDRSAFISAVLSACALCLPTTQAVAIPSLLRSQQRLVEHMVQGDPRGYQTTVATILSDTRHVLWRNATHSLTSGQLFEVGKKRSVSLSLPIPEELTGEKQLVLTAHIRTRSGKAWRRLGSLVATTRLRDGEERPRVEAVLPVPRRVGASAELWVQSSVPLVGRARVSESEPVQIVPGATMEFAIGIEEAAWGLSPVQFRLFACILDDCRQIFRERLDPKRPAQQGWQERSVSLADLAGWRVSFRFEARPVDALAEPGLSLPLWANPTIYSREPRKPRDLNLILLSLDTLRADHMSAYGYPRETTPFVGDELAARGTLFETNISAASTTAPSHMTMFTSLLPSVHGATALISGNKLPRDLVTLPELLHSHGFRTAAITENGAIDRSRGFGRGFEEYFENKLAGPGKTVGHIEETFDRGLAWLERNGDKRFFLFLHTYQVHNPFTPPPAYRKLFQNRRPELEPPPEIRPTWNPVEYDREIRYADDQVRRLVTALDRRGVLDHSIFVLTSDHGEEFLEHGFIAHGADIHNEILHVPLVFIGPGIPAARRVRTPVGLVDLMPTLLELLSVPATAQAMGKSYAALVRGGVSDGSWEKRPIFSETWYTRGYRARSLEHVKQPSFAVHVGHRKLLRFRRGEHDYRFEYYDLSSDPDEKNDLYPSQPDAAADLRLLLDSYQDYVAAERERVSKGHAGAPHLFDPEVEEKLRALGYID